MVRGISGEVLVCVVLARFCDSLVDVCYVKGEVDASFDFVVDGVDLCAEVWGAGDGVIWIVL